MVENLASLRDDFEIDDPQALFGLSIAISGHAIGLAKLDKIGGSNVFLLQRVEDLLLP
jgi:hypothetical protein